MDPSDPSTTAPSEPPPATGAGSPAGDALDTVETRLWLPEHTWLHELLLSEANASPTFRMPDLVSASVSLVFAQPDAPARIFTFLGTQLVLRPPRTARRRESMWRAQYERLLALQRSPANRHPNPRFQLDELTTACVALCREQPDVEQHLLLHARLNTAERAARGRPGPVG